MPRKNNFKAVLLGYKLRRDRNRVRYSRRDEPRAQAYYSRDLLTRSHLFDAKASERRQLGELGAMPKDNLSVSGYRDCTPC